MAAVSATPSECHQLTTMPTDTIHRRSSRNGARNGNRPPSTRSTTTAPGEKWFSLTMYPYPSGILHVGHWYAFAVPDVFARLQRMRGYNVMFPMGFDAFGLPAENAAIRNNIHPATWTYDNIPTMRHQYDLMGAMIDWSREVITCDPDYYQWNQWFFLKMLERGLGLSRQRLGLVVPERPDRAGQRAGAGGQYLRALRRRSLQARPGAVVFPDHRVRPGIAGRAGHPRLARAGQDHAAQLDRPIRRRAPGVRAGNR